MYRETRVANYILASFCIVSLTLLSLPLSAPVQTFKTSVAYILNPVAFYGAKGVERLAGVPSHVRELLSADIENRVMHEEIRKAAWVKAEADALRAENRRLRAAMGLKAPAESRAVLWARVMERDPLHWYRNLTVDAGSDDGVELNAPALGQKGDLLAAVGRVVEVRPRSSVVLLTTDDLSSVAAYLSSAAAEGLIQGQGSARLLMNYLSADASLEAGDLAYTSPTSATFPAEVLIGKVAKVLPRDPFLTFQVAEVEPAVDASTLKELMILKPLRPAPAEVPVPEPRAASAAARRPPPAPPKPPEAAAPAPSQEEAPSEVP